MNDTTTNVALCDEEYDNEPIDFDYDALPEYNKNSLARAAVEAFERFMLFRHCETRPPTTQAQAASTRQFRRRE